MMEMRMADLWLYSHFNKQEHPRRRPAAEMKETGSWRPLSALRMGGDPATFPSFTLTQQHSGMFGTEFK